MSWKEITGYEGVYEVSDDGGIRSVNRTIYQEGHGYRKLKGVDVKSHDNGNGYKYVTLHKDGGRKNHYVHILVARAFIGEYEESKQVDHIDFDRGNNSVSNLQIVTIRENVRRIFVKGRGNPPIGERSWTAKVNRKQVLEIRAKLKEGVSARELAGTYGIHETTILHIKHNRIWRHLLPNAEPPYKSRERSKLNKDQVKIIRRKHAVGASVGDLRKEYNVSWSTIYSIVTNKSWREI